MRFNYNAYDKVFPRQEKPKPRIDPEDAMIEEPEEKKLEEKKPEEKKEAEDGTGTDGESDTE